MWQLFESRNNHRIAWNLEHSYHAKYSSSNLDFYRMIFPSSSPYSLSSSSLPFSELPYQHRALRHKHSSISSWSDNLHYPPLWSILG